MDGRLTPSQMLELENKKMEEKLKGLQQMMQGEKGKKLASRPLQKGNLLS
jgi:hypothetical protein